MFLFSKLFLNYLNLVFLCHLWELCGSVGFVPSTLSFNTNHPPSSTTATSNNNKKKPPSFTRSHYMAAETAVQMSWLV